MTHKVVIVTGASSGIGLATTKAFLAAEWSVFGTDISSAPPSISNPFFRFLKTNIATADAPKAIVAACSDAFGGRIDALINVAGIMDNFSSAATVTDDLWDRVIAINLTAPVRLMREVIPTMKAQKSGSIVNVASKAGLAGANAGVAYTASKHGLVGATKNTAWVLKEDGIRCNAICPGAVKTNIGNTVDWTKVDHEAWARMKPVYDIHFDVETSEGTLSPDLPANLAVFLASDLSRGINGAIVPCDNAYSVI